MTDRSAALAAALDDAAAAVRRARTRRMKTRGGDPADGELDRLQEKLDSARAAAARGDLDREWLRLVIRWVAGWAPEDDITLLASLGALARAASTSPSE